MAVCLSEPVVAACRLRSARSWRLRRPAAQEPEARVGFARPDSGWVVQHLANEVGDFVLRRADGLFA